MIKKMSDVFELPIDATEGSGLDAIEWASKVGIYPARQHAAHAINNADALYKALQELFNDYKALADSGDAGNWKLEETSVGMEAIAALKAYRGEK